MTVKALSFGTRTKHFSFMASEENGEYFVSESSVAAIFKRANEVCDLNNEITYITCSIFPVGMKGLEADAEKYFEEDDDLTFGLHTNFFDMQPILIYFICSASHPQLRSY